MKILRRIWALVLASCFIAVKFVATIVMVVFLSALEALGMVLTLIFSRRELKCDQTFIFFGVKDREEVKRHLDNLTDGVFWFDL